MLESEFQLKLRKRLEKEFDNDGRVCVILKTDPTYIQGFPDLLILYGDKWAALECKKSSRAMHRPNQGYYVDLLNHMAFARFVHPENVEDVIVELKEYLWEL